MHDSDTRNTTTDRTAADELVDLVAAAHESGSLMLSTARLVDALLDARSDASDAEVAAVDRALTALGYRTVVTTEEALEMVASVTAAGSAVAAPAS